MLWAVMHMSMLASPVSRSIHAVVDALNQGAILESWIHFPRNIRELEAARHRFFEKYQFPGIVGCVDCTHVAIIAPAVGQPEYPEHIYVNRKNYHSLNVQLICDENLRILHADARFPGSAHDARIWAQSAVAPIMEEVYRRDPQNPFYLLGDSGYPLRPWLQTPIRNAAPHTPEERYNTALTSIRSLIERCNGVLKSRFRCLLKHRVLHFTPTMAGKIVNACVVLHNMCISANLPLPEDAQDGGQDLGHVPVAVPQQGGGNVDLAAGRHIQHNVIQEYFY